MTQSVDIKTLQAEGKGPAPCARFCEATAFKIEIAGWERDQAENLANQCELAGQLQRALIERDEWKTRLEFSFEQRDKLTAERDAARGEAIRLDAGWCRANVDLLAANLERADLLLRVHVQAGVVEAVRLANQNRTNERDELARTLAAIEIKVDTLIAERDELSRLYENALKREYAIHEAAKLALDALEHSVPTAVGFDEPYLKHAAAIEALKKVGVNHG